MVEPEVTVEETDFTESVLQEVENRMSESEKVEEEAAPQTEPPVDDSGETYYSKIFLTVLLFFNVKFILIKMTIL